MLNSRLLVGSVVVTTAIVCLLGIRFELQAARLASRHATTAPMTAHNQAH